MRKKIWSWECEDGALLIYTNVHGGGGGGGGGGGDRSRARKETWGSSLLNRSASVSCPGCRFLICKFRNFFRE